MCTDCDGTFSNSERPEGCLKRVALEAAACADRTAEEPMALAKFDLIQKAHKNTEGICHVCSGPVERALDLWDDM